MNKATKAGGLLSLSKPARRYITPEFDENPIKNKQQRAEKNYMLKKQKSGENKTTDKQTVDTTQKNVKRGYFLFLNLNC